MQGIQARRIWKLGVCSLALGLFASPALAGDLNVFAGGTFSKVRVKSLKELRFDGAVQQKHDFSCGAASLATLLTYHYDRPTTEAEAFAAMWRAGDRENIQRIGFSLLDMKRFLHSRGFAAEGFRITLEQLEEAQVPAVSLINLDGYLHFVVIKGLTEQEVLLGDPARGVHAMARADFDQARDEVLLVIPNKIQLARKHFNTAEAWKTRPRAPVRASIGQAAGSNWTLHVARQPNEF